MTVRFWLFLAVLLCVSASGLHAQGSAPTPTPKPFVVKTEEPTDETATFIYRYHKGSGIGANHASAQPTVVAPEICVELVSRNPDKFVGHVKNLGQTVITRKIVIAYTQQNWNIGAGADTGNITEISRKESTNHEKKHSKIVEMVVERFSQYAAAKAPTIVTKEYTTYSKAYDRAMAMAKQFIQDLRFHLTAKDTLAELVPAWSVKLDDYEVATVNKAGEWVVTPDPNAESKISTLMGTGAITTVPVPTDP